MRIGILTVPFNNNYGGYLQSFALILTLKKLGHSPTIIMRRHLKHDISFYEKAKFFLRGIVKTIITLQIHPCFYSVENTFIHKGKEMHRFVNKYIQPQSKYIYTTSELKRYCKNRFDAYIVGSDQVWRAKYVPGIIGNMFLDFTEGWDVKRIAYAASFGTNEPEYSENEKKECGKLLEKFDAVSFRERSGLKVIDYFGWFIHNPQVVLDPTLLLSKEDYNKYLPMKNEQVEGKIFCYVLDKNIDSRQLINSVQSELNKSLCEISNIQNGDCILPSIEFWLTAIRDADFIVTDSFHGTVFSVIFEKAFAVIPNFSRGVERFQSLLEPLGLEEHIINDNTNIERLFNTNWISVREKIRSQVAESILFINKAFEENE